MGRSLGRDFFDESIKDERANFTLADNYRNITKSQVLVTSSIKFKTLKHNYKYICELK